MQYEYFLSIFLVPRGQLPCLQSGSHCSGHSGEGDPLACAQGRGVSSGGYERPQDGSTAKGQTVHEEAGIGQVYTDPGRPSSGNNWPGCNSEYV